MAVQYNPAIVTDGLITCFDAANLKSYIPNAGTIIDLSTNNINGTLTNGPGFSSLNGGSITFDGTNDCITLANDSKLNITTENFTLECVLFYQRSTSNFARVVSRNGGYLAPGWAFYAGYWPAGNLDSVTFQWGTSTWFSLSGFPVLENTWYHACITKVNNVISIYRNGIFNDSLENSFNFNNTNQPTRIGCSTYNDGSLSEFFKGRVAIFRQYNIGLNSSQVLQNFNAIRGRFGI